MKRRTSKIKDISGYIRSMPTGATVRETNRIQVAESQRLSKMLCGILSTKQLSDVVETVRKPEKMADVLQNGLKACGLLLENNGSVRTMHRNTALDMYHAPRNIDEELDRLAEELDRLAEEYGTEYLAEHLLCHPSNLASIQMAKADCKHMHGWYSKKELQTDHHTDIDIDHYAAIFIKHMISEYLATEVTTDLNANANANDLNANDLNATDLNANANTNVTAPLEDQFASDPTLSTACVVDVLQRFLFAGEYFNPEIGASHTLELAIVDAIAYIKELINTRKALIDARKALIDARKELVKACKALVVQETNNK